MFDIEAEYSTHGLLAEWLWFFHATFEKYSGFVPGRGKKAVLKYIVYPNSANIAL